MEGSSSSSSSRTSAIDPNMPCSSKTADYIQQLKDLDEHEDDDRRIAELLQAEFDLEYDEELKRVENARNKSERESEFPKLWNFKYFLSSDSKVSVSLQKYRIYPDELLQNDEDKEDEDLVEMRRAKTWDRFEGNFIIFPKCFILKFFNLIENEKELSKIGKHGYYEDESGEIRTKHDSVSFNQFNVDFRV